MHFPAQQTVQITQFFNPSTFPTAFSQSLFPSFFIFVLLQLLKLCNFLAQTRCSLTNTIIYNTRKRSLENFGDVKSHYAIRSLRIFSHQTLKTTCDLLNWLQFFDVSNCNWNLEARTLLKTQTKQQFVFSSPILDVQCVIYFYCRSSRKMYLQSINFYYYPGNVLENRKECLQGLTHSMFY